MPPRYAYWTILIDGKATAFRAREQEELLPTFNQLARRNSDIAMKYFSRGKLWDTPEQAEWASKRLPAPGEKRTRAWRPGGTHEDPRARFKKGGSGDASARPVGNRLAAKRPIGERPIDDRPARSRPVATGESAERTPGKRWSGGKPRTPR